MKCAVSWKPAFFCRCKTKKTQRLFCSVSSHLKATQKARTMKEGGSYEFCPEWKEREWHKKSQAKNNPAHTHLLLVELATVDIT